VVFVLLSGAVGILSGIKVAVELKEELPERVERGDAKDMSFSARAMLKASGAGPPPAVILTGLKGLEEELAMLPFREC
jgi:hypothetical protein